MSVASFEKIDYSVRPAKNIERKMLCDSFSLLNRIEPLKLYQYVGFGALSFTDFKLFHTRLGIAQMMSIESKQGRKQRVEFNKPYGSIKMIWADCAEALKKVNFKHRSIIWLDYDGILNISVLEDIQFLCSKLRSGSVLIVSVNADIDAEGDTAPQVRYQKLVAEIGEERVPIRIPKTGDGLEKWGIASVFAEVIQDRILTTLRSRNGALEEKDKIDFLPLYNFNYSDGAKMLSFGGLLLNQEDSERIGPEHFSKFPFISDGWKSPFRIDPPILTRKELSYLDGLHPDIQPGKDERVKFIPKKFIENYLQLYRYVPFFEDVESRDD